MNQEFKYRELLKDELFIYWRLNPTDELDSYWKDYVSNNKSRSILLNKAIREFDAIHQKKGFSKDIDASKISLIHRKAIERKKILKHKQFILFFRYSAAAIFVAAIITALYIYNNRDINLFESEFATIGNVMDEDNVLLSSGNKTLKLNNNSKLVISEKDNSTIVKEDGAEHSVHTIDVEKNTLSVPYGKRTSIVLSDGSTIHLNSGTRLEFPARFTGNKREIHVEGEAFIEVKHDNSKPFIVSTPRSQITVYGTSFNVSSFNEDEVESVVLVSGKIEVENEQSSLILNPNELAIISDNKISRETVNVSEYISWKSGYMELNKVPLNEVLKKISRYYNIEFNFNNDLDFYSRTCSGKLFLSDNLNDVLEAFSRITFLDYDKSGNSVTIYK